MPDLQFTGKERDGETGLDYFGVRYMSSAQGRFTSPDAPLLDQRPGDPSSWNLYAYVRNNPLRFVDPTGRECRSGITVNVGEGQDGNACFEATGRADVAITNPFFFAVAQGANQAAPAVNLLGEGLVLGAEIATGAPISLLAGLGTSERSPANGQAAAAGVILRDPADIRFNQNSIGSEFKDGRNFGQTIDALRNGTVQPSEIAPIRTVEKNGLTYTLDNRRLFAASEAGTQIATRPATAREIIQNAFKFTTTSEGKVIGIRGVVTVLTRGRF